MPVNEYGRKTLKLGERFPRYTLAPFAIRPRLDPDKATKPYFVMSTNPPEYRRWVADGLIRVIPNQGTRALHISLGRSRDASRTAKGFLMAMHDHMGRLIFSAPIASLDRIPYTLAARGINVDMTPAATNVVMLTVDPLVNVPMLLTPRSYVNPRGYAPDFAILADMFGSVAILSESHLGGLTADLHNMRYNLRNNLDGQNTVAIGLRAALLEPYSDLLKKANSPDQRLCAPVSLDLRKYHGEWHDIYAAAGHPPSPFERQFNPPFLLQILDKDAERRAGNKAQAQETLAEIQGTLGYVPEVAEPPRPEAHRALAPKPPSPAPKGQDYVPKFKIIGM